MSDNKLLLIGIDQVIPYLIDRFLEEGVLPNIASLVKRGVKAEGLPCFPPDTPTNWATIASGASIARHGVTSFYLHIPGEHFGEGLKQSNRSRTQLRKYAQAEYIWEAADRQGRKPLVLNYPAGWPADFDSGIMSLLTWRIPSTVPMLISNPVIKKYEIEESMDIELADGVRASVQEDERGFPNNLYIQETEETLFVGEWSSWIPVQVSSKSGDIPGLFKIRWEEGDKNQALIHYSGVYSIEGWSRPESFAEELVRNVVQPEFELESPEGAEFWYEGSTHDYLKAARDEAKLLGESVKFAHIKHDWKTCFFHVHFLDSVNHKELAYLHKESPLHSQKEYSRAISNIRTAYEYIDDLVGSLLESVVDENTIVVFLADHGAIPAWRVANIARVLRDAGLLVYKESSREGSLEVDWSKTRAFPYLEPPYVWVNKKGRDPTGIVSDEEYEEVRQEIIDALQNMRDPDNGKQIIKQALRKEDALPLYQKGDRVGDVIFVLNPPYELFDGDVENLDVSRLPKDWLEKEYAFPASECFGAHAYYLPSERFGEFSISVPIIMAGPGVKKGVVLENMLNLMDIAPTIAHLLSIPEPKNSEGKIIEEILE